MIVTVLGPLVALAAVVVAMARGFRSLSRAPEPVRLPVPMRPRPGTRNPARY